MNRYQLKKFAIVGCLAVSSIALLGVLKSATQAVPSADANQMTQSESQENDRSSASYQRPIVQFQATEFAFQTQIDLPSESVNSEQYSESITANNGALDLTLIDQGNALTYLFQVSSRRNSDCESGGTACQAARARGDVAEVQFTLPKQPLRAGVYPLESASGNEAIVASRQLYSDPAHGQLGCQVWGEARLTVANVEYDANGNLTNLDAAIERTCQQTAPLPVLPPQDQSLQQTIEPIASYTYRASWQSRLVPSE